MSDSDTESDEVMMPTSIEWNRRDDEATESFWKIQDILKPHGMLDTRMAYTNFMIWIHPQTESQFDN